VSEPSAPVSGGAAPPDNVDRADRAALDTRTNDLEEAYEYFLAYAAQGIPQESGQIRDFLGRFDRALDGLGGFFTRYVGNLGLDANAYQAFIDVIDRDARAARAAVRMVLAQPAITSQIVDNLNASIHVRALLTDLFLIDEVLKAHV
jgi:hypothetical protein